MSLYVLAAYSFGIFCGTAISFLERLFRQRETMRKRLLSDEEIDRIAEATILSLPDGAAGMLKTWGWQQFAHALLDACEEEEPPLGGEAP